MGTRNLTIVKIDGKVKVRQYCQWDGYPTGVGVEIANFIKTMNLRSFKAKVKKVKFLKTKEIQKQIDDVLGHSNSSISFEESDRLKLALPALHRDTGPRILNLIQSGDAVEMWDGGRFTKDSWCEYAYEIDLDNKTVTVVYGFSRKDRKKYSFTSFTKKAMVALEKELYARWNNFSE